MSYNIVTSVEVEDVKLYYSGCFTLTGSTVPKLITLQHPLYVVFNDGMY